MDTNNIFSIMNKYKKPENFMTAGLWYVLRTLRENDPRICCEILNKICFNDNDKEHLDQVKLRELDFRCQKRSDNGIKRTVYDLTIESSEYLIYFEIKDESDFSKDQIPSYIKKLKEEIGDRYGRLVILRNYFSEREKVPNQDEKYIKRIRWSHIFTRDIFKQKACSLNKYLMKSYSEFLHEKGVLEMNAININHLKQGIPAVLNTMKIVKDAINDEIGEKAETDWDLEGYFIGLSFRKDNRSYEIGINIEEPTELRIYVNIKGKVKRALKNGKFEEDKFFGQAYISGSLIDILQSDDKQQDKIYNLVNKLYLKAKGEIEIAV